MHMHDNNNNDTTLFKGVSCRGVFKPEWGRWNRRIRIYCRSI